MEEEESFTICKMDDIDVILGLTFLEAYNGVFKGKKRELVVQSDGKELVLPLTKSSGAFGRRLNFIRYGLCKEIRRKTACRTRYGSFEFMVKPFGLYNAPTTFTTLMNNLFHEYLDDSMIIYIDDILVYSKTAKEHTEHLEKVLQKLRSNKLYAKGDKCDWGKLRITFLGHELTQVGHGG